MKAAMSLLQGSKPESSNTNNDTKKCKYVIPSSEKKREIKSKYCNIITEQKEYIQKSFQKSLDEYSGKLIDNFTSDDFMNFINKNIFDYLVPIFDENKHSQYALLIDMEDIIVETLSAAIKSSDNSINEQSLYDAFVLLLSQKVDNTTPVVQKQQGGANRKLPPGAFADLHDLYDFFGPKKPTQSPQSQPAQSQSQPAQSGFTQNPIYQQPQYQQYQQYQPYPMQYANVPTQLYPPYSNNNNNNNDVPIPSTADENKVISDVSEFLKKNIDGKTVNSEILSIIKKTLNDAINEKS